VRSRESRRGVGPTTSPAPSQPPPSLVSSAALCLASPSAGEEASPPRSASHPPPAREEAAPPRSASHSPPARKERPVRDKLCSPVPRLTSPRRRPARAAAAPPPHVAADRAPAGCGVGSRRYTWPFGTSTTGRHEHDPKKHDTSTVRHDVDSASARHGTT
jgi:hypothetical protein